MNIEELKMELEEANEKIKSLKGQISRLENFVKYNRLPKTNILSDKFLTRAFAILGHSMVANLIIVVPIYILIILMVLFINLSY